MPLSHRRGLKKPEASVVKQLSLLITFLLSFASSAFATVTVTSPTAGSTVNSPVHYVASATTSTCSKGVGSMGIYVNNKLVYVVNATKLDHWLTLAAGYEHTVVEEWDHCGGASYTTINLTVKSSTTSAPTVGVSASPSSITAGSSSTLTVTATNASTVTLTGSDGSSYTLSSSGGTKAVTPSASTTYTATATGSGGSASAKTTVTVTAPSAPAASVKANPTSITAGQSSTLTVTATNATSVTLTGSDGSSYTVSSTGGSVTVTPSTTTTYTADATASGGSVSASATVTVATQGSASAINHVVFMLQENHSFDNYFGMLNPYRRSKGWNIGDDGHTYDVDGIDDKLNTTNVTDEGVHIPLFKLKSTCIDDATSSWLESYGDINRYNFLQTRPILMDGFVHNAEGFAKSCASSGTCSGQFTDTTGQRAMGYYDEGFLNYDYYIASQFAVSDRWFSPVSSKSIPNRLATFSGGTTQGLVFDPGSNDHLPQLSIATIFQELDNAKVSWKIYYSATQGFCTAGTACGSGTTNYPATSFSTFSYSYRYWYGNPSQAACTGTTKPSSVVGDPSNSFCVDPNHIAPTSTYFADVANGTLASFSFIESGSGLNDEHPGSGQSILTGQSEVAKVVNALMTSPSWKDSVFFLSYDEGGGPYDHVPPVPGHSNDNTSAGLGSIPDISTIGINPDSYLPCLPAGGTPTTHCDLNASEPGAHSGDAAAVNGFAAQLGFRVPNFIVSPFTRRHYVSHAPMDHTAVIRFVENRFIGSSAHLTARDAAQPNLLDFFDFTGVPWATPPTPPAPVTPTQLGYNPCTPTSM
jgi:phospholipase C